MTWAHPSAAAASGRGAMANSARFPSGPFRTTQGRPRPARPGAPGLEDHPLVVPQDAVDCVGSPEVDQRPRRLNVQLKLDAHSGDDPERVTPARQAVSTQLLELGKVRSADVADGRAPGRSTLPSKWRRPGERPLAGR